MRHLSRPGHRHPLYVTDPETGRLYAVPQGGDENDGDEGGEGEGQGDGDGEGSGDGDSSGDGDGDGSGDGQGDGEGEGEGEPQFSGAQQAHIQKLLDEKLGKERAKHERALKRAKKAAKDSGDSDGNEADAKTAEALTKATGRVVATEVKAAALAAGVPADKVKRFARLVDAEVSELVDDDGDPDEDAIADLVDETLEEWPEFAATATTKGKGGPSGSEGHGGEKRKTKVWTRAEIGKLSEKDYEDNREEIEEQVKKGLVK